MVTYDTTKYMKVGVEMALDFLSSDKISRKKLYAEIEGIITSDDISVYAKSEEVKKHIDDYITNVFYKNIAEMLTIIYDGDFKQLSKDIVAARLAGAGNEKSRYRRSM